jgi:hypothetical protein
MSDDQNLDSNGPVQNTDENHNNQEGFGNGGDYNRSRYGRQGYSSAEHRRGPAAEEAANSDNKGNNTAPTDPYRYGYQEYREGDTPGRESYLTDFDQDRSTTQESHQPYPGSSYAGNQRDDQSYQGKWGQSTSGHYTDPAVASDPQMQEDLGNPNDQTK